MLLAVQGLTRQYTRGNRPFSAVDKVCFCLERGEFVNIIGRSGSGKTTLLNLLAGLLKPTEGEIILDGAPISALNDREMSALRNEKIGYIPQGARALPHLTVLDNVRLPFYLSKRSGDAAGRAMFLLEAVGIGGLAAQFPSEISGGELRRVLIARALMNEPALLIADEPTSDLDTQTTTEVMELFADMNRKGATILMVTHEEDALRYGNRTLVMSDGNLKHNV
jgi:putative ABC transport system ATP-binding protein